MNQPPAPTNDAPSQSYADAYQPPAPSPASDPVVQPAAAAPVSDAAPVGEGLEQQNIFEMLRVEQASEQDKEAFLDELQQIIWDDFLENDVPLLLTESEQSELATIRGKVYENELAKQEAIVVYLEKLIPDMEDIMLEKALELKADLFKDQVADAKTRLSADATHQSVLTQIDEAVTAEKWATAIKLLRTLPEV